MGVGVAVTSRKGFLGDFSSKLGIFFYNRPPIWVTWVAPEAQVHVSERKNGEMDTTSGCWAHIKTFAADQAGFRGQGKRIILVIISAPLPVIVTNVCKGVREVKKKH